MKSDTVQLCFDVLTVNQTNVPLEFEVIWYSLWLYPSIISQLSVCEFASLLIFELASLFQLKRRPACPLIAYFKLVGTFVIRTLLNGASVVHVMS